jgi:hypothetical protein
LRGELKARRTVRDIDESLRRGIGHDGLYSVMRFRGSAVARDAGPAWRACASYMRLCLGFGSGKTLVGELPLFDGARPGS